MCPTVSVGIPTYNRSVLLSQAIQSVLQQSYQDFEIIVSDDSSSDLTPEVVRSFADPRIRYHRTATNLRPPRNWNECVRLAKGEFFALLPDDDVYLPGFLEAMVVVLQQQPNIGFAQCGFVGVDEHLRCLEVVEAHSLPLKLSGESAVIWQMEHLACNPVALLFRRSAMLAMGLWREDYWDDWAFIIRLAYRYGFVFVPKLLACNRTHDQNLSRQLFVEGRDGILDRINQQADVFGEALPATPALIALRARLDRQLSHYCVFTALRSLRRGEWAKARFHFARARQLYALAGIDPRIIKQISDGLAARVRGRRNREAARRREPVIKLSGLSSTSRSES